MTDPKPEEPKPDASKPDLAPDQPSKDDEDIAEELPLEPGDANSQPV